MKTVVLILLALVCALGSAYAQNWSAFGTTPNTHLYEVYDPTLTHTNLLPLVEGITAGADDFGMSPLYGLRIEQTSAPLSPLRVWNGKPVNNLLYGINPDFGRFPLEESRQHEDTVWLNSGTHSLEFRLNSQPSVPNLAAELSDGNLYLVLDSIYGTDGGTDSLATFRGLVFDDSMNPIPNHRFNNQPLILWSKNRGLLHFLDLSFIEERLVTFSQKTYTEPLEEDIFNFDVGDKFLFKNMDLGTSYYYYTLVEIISETETDSSFIYGEKHTRNNGDVTYEDLVVKKDSTLRNLLYEPPASPLYMDSIIYGNASGVGEYSWTYIHGTPEIQARRILYLPDYVWVVPTEYCMRTQMYVEGVGILHKFCRPGPNEWGQIVAQYDQKTLVAYQKANGDSYGSIPTNFSIDEWPQNNIMAYPNPVSDVLYLRGNGKEYELLNIWGQMVEQTSYNWPQSLSLSHLPAGVYLLRVTTTYGQVHVAKIIKK